MIDREKSIQYLLDTYGKECVAQIITFTKLKLKSLIKDGMRILELPFDEGNQVTTALPDLIDGKEVTFNLLKEINDNKDLYIADLGEYKVNAIIKAYNSVCNLFSKYPELEGIATHLSGCLRNTGIHAAGVIVSSKVLLDNIPLTSGSDTAVLPLSQICMADLGFFNALKIDDLGLSTLSQIQTCMNLVGLDMSWYDSEDFDDPKVFEMLRKGLTSDIFQMSSYNGTRMIRDMRANSFEDLSAINALNRPGPLSKDKETGISLTDTYIANKINNTMTNLHTSLDSILSETYGNIVYQEQCMAIGQVVAGYSLGNADLRIRKVIGKKLVDKIPEIKAEFVYGKKYDYDTKTMTDESSPYCVGAINRGYTEDFALYIFELISNFSKYSFNKPHSGGYAVIAYKTAWLKYYYPVEWAVSCLLTHSESEDIISTLNDAKRLGIEVLPPNINDSDYSFKISIINNTKYIQYGLGAIKDVGGIAINLISNIRPFDSFSDFYKKCYSVPKKTNPLTGRTIQNPVNKKCIVALIKAGVFDCFNINRYELLNEYLFDIRKEKKLERYDPLSFHSNIKLEMEKECMGQYVSEHPLDPFPYNSYDSLDDGDNIIVGGIIKTITIKKNKRKKEFANVCIETKDGKLRRGLVHDKQYDVYKRYLIKDSIVVLDGRVNKEYGNIVVYNIYPKEVYL